MGKSYCNQLLGVARSKGLILLSFLLDIAHLFIVIPVTHCSYLVTRVVRLAKVFRRGSGTLLIQKANDYRI